VTTDHISPAGAIKPSQPAGGYLQRKGVEKKDFNSFGSRRGNHEVMMRGTFDNIRVRNHLAPGKEGGWTTYFGPDAEAWVPVELTSQLDNWGNYWLSGVARRRDGVDLDMAQECLADILRASERKVTIDEIIRKVADHYNLRMSDLLSARRARAVARPRQVAMFLAKTLTSRSLPEIGRRFGGRDHTTVIHAVRKIEELKATDAQVAEDVELLRRMLEA